MRETSEKILVTDFDGTLARQDFYRLARQYLIPADTPDYWRLFLNGELSHFEVLRQYFAAIHADDHEVERVLSKMDLDEKFFELGGKLHSDGWEIVIASAGCAWYIERLLKGCPFPFTLHASPGRWLGREGGLVMSLPLQSRFLSSTHGIDKVSVVRDALSRASIVAFAGDGIPDADAATLVDESYRFARADCAAILKERGLPYTTFELWREFGEYLLSNRNSPA